jgi:hypothetical protein
MKLSEITWWRRVPAEDGEVSWFCVTACELWAPQGHVISEVVVQLFKRCFASFVVGEFKRLWVGFLAPVELNPVCSIQCGFLLGSFYISLASNTCNFVAVK